MYFEEKWFMVLCVRLSNCMHMKIMTSNVETEEISDYEEGEIVDDDPPNLNPKELFVNKFDDNRNCNLNQPEKSCNVFSSRFPHGKSVPYKIVSSPGTRIRELPSLQSRRNTQRRINRDSKRIKCKRLVQRNKRNDSPRPASHCNSNWRQGLMRNERVRVKQGTSYEERLREFQCREQKIKGSLGQDDRHSRAIPNLIEVESTGTSLLKRLVGSGSLDIKILDENVLDQDKSNVAPNTLDETSKCASPIDESVLSISHNSYSNIDSLNNSDQQSSVTPTIAKNEHQTSSTDDIDDEWKLRLDALRTAVLKKHNERLKRGLLPKKNTSSTCDSIIDSFMDELEPIGLLTCSNEDNSIDVIENSGNDLNLIKSDDCMDMSMDSNYVSDEDPLRQDLILVTSERSEERTEESCITQEASARVEMPKEEAKSNDTGNVLFDMTDEEIELRALALQSVLLKKPFNPPTGEDKNDSISAVYAKNENIEKNLAVEIKEDGVAMKGMKRKDLEDWEEFDEDILRAQLLKTLSSKLPDHSILDSVLAVDDPMALTSHRNSAPSTSKKEIDMEHEIQCRLWTEKMVPELIISLNGSDSDSEPETTPQLDFVKSLNIFLQEAKKKSEIAAKPKMKKKVTSPKSTAKKILLKKTASSTPTAVKHLPIQQQEEYRKLKMKLVEKMSSSNPSKNLAPSKPITSKIEQNNVAVSKVGLQNAQNNIPVVKSDKMQNIPKDVSLIKDVHLKTVPKVASKINLISISKGNNLNLSSQKSNSVNVGNKRLKIDHTFFANKNQSSLKLNTKNRPNMNTSTQFNSTPSSSTNLTIKRGNTIPLKSDQITLKTQTKLINRVPVKSVRTIKSESTTNLRKNVPSIYKTSIPSKLLSNPPNNSPIRDLKQISQRVSFKFDSLKDRPEVVGDVDGGSVCINVSEEENGTQKDSFSIKFVRDSNLAALEKKNSTLTEQEGDISSELNKHSSCAKENEWSSDKENNGKTLKIGPMKPSNDDHRLTSCTLGNESESDLVTKLQEAQGKYVETSALVKRLESELKAAKKDLTDGGRRIDQLKEKLSVLCKPSTLNVNFSDEAYPEDSVEAELTKPDQVLKLKDPPKDTNRCAWDPDGVVCPFQLAGSCKDPVCSFHHIPTP